MAGPITQQQRNDVVPSLFNDVMNAIFSNAPAAQKSQSNTSQGQTANASSDQQVSQQIVADIDPLGALKQETATKVVKDRLTKDAELMPTDTLATFIKPPAQSGSAGQPGSQPSGQPGTQQQPSAPQQTDNSFGNDESGRTLPKDWLGKLFYIGSEKEEPGAVWKVLNFMAGNGLPQAADTTGSTTSALQTLMIKQLGEQQTEQRKTQQGFNLIKADLKDMVSAYKKVPFKGNVMGRIGGLGAATVGKVTGSGRKDRSEFETSSDSLVYNVASYIAGQEGRALSDRDLQLVGKWAKFSLSDKAEDFEGKLQTVINKANNKLKTSNPNAQLLPSAKEFMKQTQEEGQQGKTGVGNIKSITPMGE